MDMSFIFYPWAREGPHHKLNKLYFKKRKKQKKKKKKKKKT